MGFTTKRTRSAVRWRSFDSTCRRRSDGRKAAYVVPPRPAKRAAMRIGFDTSIFKSYDVRGIVPAQINPDVAYAIGRAFVDALGRKNICIGRDMRPSGIDLMEALTTGAIDGGADVTQIGLISTDCLYFAVGHYGFDGGVMITASHNPAEYNGLKFCREDAIAIALETGLADVRDAAAAGNFRAPARAGRVAQQAVLDAFAQHCL